MKDLFELSIFGWPMPEILMISTILVLISEIGRSSDGFDCLNKGLPLISMRMARGLV